ncbi:MAG: metal-dependent transcriptional regulator [Nitrososphaerota archaeon]|nr:metal-dependent transcriptional regulator [Nitrososphaerota archaeon]
MALGLTERDYDCMVSINALTFKGWPARVKEISASMKVKPPTAVGFLEKLTGLNLVEKGNIGYRLTGRGKEVLDSVTRAHRLFETLLSEAGIPLDNACRISSSIDRHVNGDFLEALCSVLRHPDRCPHGSPIPGGVRHV